jgi:linoleoyl-CoA desaturase
MSQKSKFFKTWLQVKKDEKTKSPDDHWNEKINAEYRAKDDFKIKEKELNTLYSLGIIAAHVVPETDFVQATEGQTKDLSIENNFLIHQLETTSDFAPKSKVLAWFIGGLNYQVEHHLFPNVCHVHYKALSKIVKETAADFDLPYHCHKTFVGALVAHGKMLKKLGKA